MRAMQVAPISKVFNRECREKTLDLASKPYVLEYAGRNQSDFIVFNKSLVAYALNGDIRTVPSLMEKYPELSDIATWTELVRCILTQIQASPGDVRMLQPLASANWLAFILGLEQRLALHGIRFMQVMFGQVIQSAVQRSDISAVLRIIEHMRENTFVRFSTNMLRMVLGLEYLFDLKCALVKSTLSGCVGVRLGHKLLAQVGWMVRSEADIGQLPEIVDLFKQKYGIEMKGVDYDYLAELCMQLGAFDMLRCWIGARVARLELLPNFTANSMVVA
ncbi:hypothetical protein GGI13_006714 [Coemansia sp. RSA 455]|nr:hypothetical protein GGI13_006714 [Coemansia sp. RSA 455]KAJ2466871.1 hypothetical protein GGI03_001869 [Coemansia sp. RSA 2337]